MKKTLKNFLCAASVSLLALPALAEKAFVECHSTYGLHVYLSQPSSDGIATLKVIWGEQYLVFTDVEANFSGKVGTAVKGDKVRLEVYPGEPAVGQLLLKGQTSSLQCQ